MTDSSYGLRFDIYERVHLSEQVTGIDELEEIELFPRIQVVPGEEYASLRGHLLLSGLYRGEGGTHELEHWIPVEITIPLSRVGKLEDIAVEIENFDVDLLSARSLNITGVLSLQGIETSSVSVDPEEWKDREFVTSHEPAPDFRGEAETNRSNPWGREFQTGNNERNYADPFRAWEQEAQPGSEDADEQPQVLKWNNVDSPLFAQAVLEDKGDADWTETPGGPREPVFEEWAENADEAPDERYGRWREAAREPDDAQREPEHALPVTAAETVQHLEERDRMEAAPESAPLAEYENELPVLAEADPLEEAVSETLEDKDQIRPEPAEEKKEMKIALGSKKNEAGQRDDHFGISKLLSTPRQDAEPAFEAGEQESVQAAAQDSGDGEEVRWKSLFIGNNEEQTPFRKVKLVIVQREETLDEIAERYQLSTRELQLYNRLSEQHLNEGQVLYIP
ncbi:LysM peptidoglycan-binding domain-containing protein [Paenibacillus faecis]|uniref:LysM peptidoglycan-binding domain-containing protein n=1 Tax=Paenibacillus faecis TaxID=862114 RepID=A0A5D0CPC1_9BACL|nr:LysM peptidoglycan-binding domain-containing protein [Paenibacillus faecis]TYA11035.1 LysM peptidoglycan-binding domain-containing protein [Paenibacillus faecis]